MRELGSRVFHLGEGDEGEHSHRREHDGGNQHDHGRTHVGAEEGDGGQPATESETTAQLALKRSESCFVKALFERRDVSAMASFFSGQMF